MGKQFFLMVKAFNKNRAQQIFIIIAIAAIWLFPVCAHAQLKGGTGKMDITDYQVLNNDPLYVKALALDDGTTKMVIITLDVVAIEEIGPIKNGYLEKVRSQIQKDLNIKPSNVLVNVSHCHGIVRSDVADLTVQAVKQACSNMVALNVGVGTGFENRVMENRRYIMKDGSQADVRRAYSLPPDDEIASIGPIDPEIGILRFDRKNGKTLAVVYNFAVHPIEGVPNGGNTADMIGFASKVIEENVDGAMALFIQGCAGDINPVNYKSLETPPDAEPLGNLLGLSVLRALKKIHATPSGKIKVINETMDLPRADFQRRIDTLEAKELRLLHSLKQTNINLKMYIPLLIKYNYSKEYPSFYAQRYLHDKQIGTYDMLRLDSINRKDMDNYRSNIYIMEHLTRIQENLRLVKMHQARSAGKKTINVEMLGVKIGDMKLVTFPGELTVQIGLNIKKKASDEFTFVAGYTNGYIFYSPTAEQLRNTGEAQEDCDTNLAPEWQEMFEKRAAEILGKL
jgi:hypothetical protein